MEFLQHRHLHVWQTPTPAPKLVVDTSVTNFYDFTADSFRLEGYTPAPFEDAIPVAI